MESRMGMTPRGTEKLTLSTKLGYGAGDIFGGGAMTVVGFFYLYFLTDVVRIRPALAGVVFLVSKIWDAVNDPMMGMLSDRTRSSMGRRRPYILAGIPLIFVSFILMWNPVAFEQELFRFVYVICTYILFSMVITMVMIPYTALASELSGDYNERTSLASFRMVFSGVAGILCATIPLEIVHAFGDPRKGYLAMGAVFGLLFSLPFFLTLFTCRENPEFRVDQTSPGLKETLRAFVLPFKIRSFRNVMMMYVFSFVAIDALMAVMIYFVTYYLKMENRMTVILAVLYIVQIFCVPLAASFGKRAGKKAGFLWAVIFWIGVLLSSLLLGPETPFAFVLVFAALLGLATAGVSVMIYAIFPDIPDIDELVTGKRREGIYSGLFTFMRKLSSAAALFMISLSIQYSGYRAPVEEMVDGVTRTVQLEQTEQFLLLLRFILAFAPILVLLLCVVSSLRYPLNPEVHGRLKQFLARRRDGHSADLETEEKELKLILAGS